MISSTQSHYYYSFEKHALIIHKSMEAQKQKKNHVGVNGTKSNKRQRPK